MGLLAGLLLVTLGASWTSAIQVSRLPHVLATVDFGKEQVLAVSVEGNGVVVVSNAGDGAPARVRCFLPTGKELWSRDIEGSVVAAYFAAGRLMVTKRSAKDWSVFHVEVLDLAGGTSMRTLTVALDQSTRLSADGNAVVSYDEPIQKIGGNWQIRSVLGEQTRSFTVDGAIGSIAAADYSRVFLLQTSGRLDAFVDRRRVWTKQAATDFTVNGLQVTPDGRTVLVRAPLGRFAVYDGTTGEELFRYNPSTVSAALDALGLEEEAIRQAITRTQARDSTLTAGIVAQNLLPVLTPDGAIYVEDPLRVIGAIIELDPRTQTARRTRASAQISEALAKVGLPDAGTKLSRISADGRTVSLGPSLRRAAVLYQSKVFILALQ
jgi:hypothetical protein